MEEGGDELFLLKDFCIGILQSVRKFSLPGIQSSADNQNGTQLDVFAIFQNIFWPSNLYLTLKSGIAEPGHSNPEGRRFSLWWRSKSSSELFVLKS